MRDAVRSSEQRRDAGRSGRVARIGLALFGRLSAWLLRLLGSTWRVELLGRDPRAHPGTDSEALLAALYHESMLPSSWLFRDQGHAVAISRSRDGHLVASTLRHLGYAEPARGSSSRGGSTALRQMVRQIDAGRTVSVLVDGPRGPARRSKAGILALSRLTGRPIHPIVFAARPALRLRSWDATLLPLPFARVVCAFGGPVPVDEASNGGQEESSTRRLDQEMEDLRRAAEETLARTQA